MKYLLVVAGNYFRTLAQEASLWVEFWQLTYCVIPKGNWPKPGSPMCGAAI